MHSNMPLNILKFWCIILAFVPVFFIVKKNQHQLNQQPRKRLKSLSQIYKNYNIVYGFDHWLEFADRYEFHLQLLLSDFAKTQTIRMLEIGVSYGGSVEVWKEYFLH